MKKSFPLLLLLSVLTLSRAAAQFYTARLVDAATHAPVAYANIGILDGETGTNSDENGRFTLNIPPSLGDKTLAISLIGYEDLKLPVGEFIRKSGANADIELRKGAKQLGEVVVRPARMITAQLGNTRTCLEGDGSVPFPFVLPEKKRRNGTVRRESDTLTEIGTLMRVKSKTTFIDSVAVTVGPCTYPEVFYRINLYEMVDGQPKNILAEPLYVRRTAEELRSGVIRVPLQDRNLMVHDDFIVSIERVKDLGTGSFLICGSLAGAPAYLRIASHQAALHKVPLLSFGISAYVTYRKD